MIASNVLRQIQCAMPGIALMAGVCLGGAAQAALMPVTNLTTNPALPGAPLTQTGRIIDSITVDSVVYSDLTSVSSVLFAADRERMWATDGTDPGSDAAAIVGLDYGTGTLNVDQGTEFRFGRTLAQSERVFIIRDGAPGVAETITLQAINLSNAVIGTLAITIDNTDVGGSLGPGATLQRESGAADLAGRDRVGLSFLVSDILGTGDKSQIAGLRVANSGNPSVWDVTAVGLAVIPEPGTLALAAAGGLMLLVRRRGAGV